MERYGVKSPGNTPEGREKARQTWLKNYGVDNPNKSEKIRVKSEETCQRKYGARNPLCKDSSLKGEIDKRNLEKYGTTDPGNRPEACEKRKQTNITRFGKEWYTQTNEWVNRVHNTSLKRYGVSHPMKLDEIKEKQRKTIYEHYGVYSPMQNPESVRKLNHHMMEKYGVPWPCMTPQCIKAKGTRISKINKSFGKLLEENKILHSYEFPLGRKQFDFHLPSYNILIDINPSYTHTIKEIERFSSVEFDSHLERTKLAEKNGYWLIHIWQWDNWNDIIELILNHSEMFYLDKFKHIKDGIVYIDYSKIGKSILQKFDIEIEDEIPPSIHWSKDKNHMYDFEVKEDLSDTHWLPVVDCGYLVCKEF